MTASRQALAVAAITAACAAGLWLFGSLSDARVQSAAKALQQRDVAAVLDGVRYTNVPTDDVVIVRDAERLGGNTPRRVFRAWDGTTPSGAAIETRAPAGYSGPIELLVGVRVDGSISGVRITSHRETRGLGDRIELGRSDWVLGFNTRTLGDPPLERWTVKRDGGAFDQFTGATVTPRAVVEAVRDALLYFNEHRDDVFAPNETTS